MKKILSLLLLVGLVSYGGQASGQRLVLGLKGGPNFTNWAGDDASFEFDAGAGNVTISPASGTGFAFGAFAQVNLIGGLGVTAEAFLTTRNVKYEFMGESLEFENKTFELPILLQFRLPLPGPVKPKIFAGPSFTFGREANIGGSQGAAFEAAVTTGGARWDYGDGEPDYFKQSNIQAVVGVGVDIKLPFINLTGDVRYNRSLQSDANDFMGEEIDVKVQGFAVMVGVGIGIGVL